MSYFWHRTPRHRDGLAVLLLAVPWFVCLLALSFPTQIALVTLDSIVTSTLFGFQKWLRILAKFAIS